MCQFGKNNGLHVDGEMAGVSRQKGSGIRWKRDETGTNWFVHSPADSHLAYQLRWQSHNQVTGLPFSASINEGSKSGFLNKLHKCYFRDQRAICQVEKPERNSIRQSVRALLNEVENGAG